MIYAERVVWQMTDSGYELVEKVERYWPYEVEECKTGNQVFTGGGAPPAAAAPVRSMFSSNGDFNAANNMFTKNPNFYNAVISRNYSQVDGMGKLVAALFGNSGWANSVRNYKPPIQAPAPIAQIPESWKILLSRRPQ